MKHLKLLFLVNLVVVVGSAQTVRFRCGNKEITIYEAAKHPKNLPFTVDNSFFQNDTLRMDLEGFGNEKDTLKWNILFIPKTGTTFFTKYKGKSPWIIPSISNLTSITLKGKYAKVILTVQGGKTTMLPFVLNVEDAIKPKK